MLKVNFFLGEGLLGKAPPPPPSVQLGLNIFSVLLYVQFLLFVL